MMRLGIAITARSATCVGKWKKLQNCIRSAINIQESHLTQNLILQLKFIGCKFIALLESSHFRVNTSMNWNQIWSPPLTLMTAMATEMRWRRATVTVTVRTSTKVTKTATTFKWLCSCNDSTQIHQHRHHHYLQKNYDRNTVMIWANLEAETWDVQ